MPLKTSKSSTLQSHESWNNNGYLVELDYHELEVLVNVRSKCDSILPLLQINYSLFQIDANGKQGYLYPCNEELSIRLLDLIGNFKRVTGLKPLLPWYVSSCNSFSFYHVC